MLTRKPLKMVKFKSPSSENQPTVQPQKKVSTEQPIWQKFLNQFAFDGLELKPILIWLSKSFWKTTMDKNSA